MVGEIGAPAVTGIGERLRAMWDDPRGKLMIVGAGIVLVFVWIKKSGAATAASPLAGLSTATTLPSADGQPTSTGITNAAPPDLSGIFGSPANTTNVPNLSSIFGPSNFSASPGVPLAGVNLAPPAPGLDPSLPPNVNTGLIPGLSIPQQRDLSGYTPPAIEPIAQPHESAGVTAPNQNKVTAIPSAPNLQVHQAPLASVAHPLAASLQTVGKQDVAPKMPSAYVPHKGAAIHAPVTRPAPHPTVHPPRPPAQGRTPQQTIRGRLRLR